MQTGERADKIQEFKKICQAHRLKITPQRIAIYQELFNSDTHPAADTIYQVVKKEYTNISFDTVNRTLLTFAKIGIVEVVEIFGGAKRFDPNVTNHHHIHCTQCGKILDFYSRAYDNLAVPDGVYEQFQVVSKRVILKGICKECRK
jgi:Fur family peroxide stress response transcriptional regulator